MVVQLRLPPLFGLVRQLWQGWLDDWRLRESFERPAGHLATQLISKNRIFKSQVGIVILFLTIFDGSAAMMAGSQLIHKSRWWWNWRGCYLKRELHPLVWAKITIIFFVSLPTVYQPFRCHQRSYFCNENSQLSCEDSCGFYWSTFKLVFSNVKPKLRLGFS